MAIGAVKIAAMVLRLIRQRCMTVIGGSPAIGDVAGVTLIVGIEMICILPNCRDAVVAGRT